MKDREYRLPLAVDVEIVVTRSSAQPMEYSVVLVARRDGQWQAVRSFDNAHDVQEHHEHHYIGAEKQPPTVTHGPPQAAAGNAQLMLREHWADIVAEWERTR